MVRVLVVFVAVLAGGLALGTQLTYSAAETAYRDAVAARLRMIALQVAATIQTSQSLGIALDAQDTLPALIAREAAGVPDLAAIEIVDPAGTVLHATASVAGGGDAIVVPVVDDLGQQTGIVRMVRDGSGERARLDAMRSGLMARALPIGIGILAVAGLAFAAVSRRPPARIPAPGAGERR